MPNAAVAGVPVGEEPGYRPVRVAGVGTLPREVTLYVCGITPYDATHLGHAFTYVTFDHLVRVLRVTGHTVTYAQNVTDVDDPLLERATQTGEDWRSLARREIEIYFADMEALRVLPPEHYVGAVESIPLVVDAVARLRSAGAAYVVGHPDATGQGAGDVYADVSADPGFRPPLAPDEVLGVFAERGGDPGRAGKREALDPLLWRARRVGEPSWDGGDLGPGRPGWHIECATIAAEFLGGVPTITGGGRDLAFPHHTMSASHLNQLGHPGRCATMHVGMVGYEGAKMSKSLGNLVFVSRMLRSGTDPRALRLALASHHYAEDWEWHGDELAAAQERVEVWTRAAQAERDLALDAELVAELLSALTDNLDTPGALRAVDRWAASVLRGVAAHVGPDRDGALTPAGRAVDALLGVRL